jgi:very-short-patch-repair endonuclease
VKHHLPSGAIERARRLRREMTPAERRLWRVLRESFPDAYFRKHAPIRHYIVDFVSHRAKLVVEVDGGQHSEDVDRDRTAILESEGYRVIRFWNNEVLGNPDGVWSVLDRVLTEPHPHPNLPHRGGGL